MNFNNYTIKSQETVQQAQQLAQELGHNQIENEHIFKAIALVDETTEGYAEHFLINCAHPEHFADILEEGSDWMQRVRGVIANASRCSHAELDEAEELDDGNPVELGQQLNALRNRFPQFLTMGGCCGTDLRHMAQIAKKA